MTTQKGQLRFNIARVPRVLCVALCVAFLSDVAIPAQSLPPSDTQALPNAPLSTGRITGTVADATGALVSGATINLQSGNNSIATTSSSDGTFVFGDVPAGAFTVIATMKGFTTSSVKGVLLAGQSYSLPVMSMKMEEVEVSVNALSQKQLAQLQVHAEEQQRVLGVLPNFFVAYDWKAQPLTPKQKFSLVATTFRDPINIAIAAGVAGIQQSDNALSGYGPGAAGYGKRFGANYGGLLIGTTLGGGVFPVIFHQDPRYFYKGTGSTKSRLLYSLSRAIICRGDNGKSQFAVASILGDFSAGAIANTYYPASDRNGAGVTLANGFIAVGSDAIGNVFQEFIVRKFTPKSRRGVINATTTESRQR